jgi:hypothetical protein
MLKKTLSHKQFEHRLIRIAELKLGIKWGRGFKRSLAKAISARDSTVQRWFKDSYPEAEYLAKLHKVFGITPNALLGIKAPTILPHVVSEELPSPHIKLSTALSGEIELEPSTFVLIPLVHCCESQSILEKLPLKGLEVEDWTILNQVEIPEQKKNLISMRFCGRLESSMAPLFKPFDVAIIDLDDKKIQPNQIYVVLFEDHPTVRRLQQINENQFLLIPENKDYEIKTISAKDEHSPIIGKVICSIARH